MPDPVTEAGKSLLTRFASGLRFPQLFMLAAGLFLLDLLIPDLIPFFDEILLGLLTLLLGNWKSEAGAARTSGTSGDKPPIKDVTPEGES